MKRLGIFLSMAAFMFALSLTAIAGEGKDKDKAKCEWKKECCKKDDSANKSAESKKEQPAK